MKQKDIVLILVVVLISSGISLTVTKMLFTSPKNRQEKVEVVEPISGEFTQLSDKYFNSNSIDPTLTIKIGDNNNDSPFKSKQ